MMFVVVSAEAEFHRPARYADVVQVSCGVQRATRASLTLQQDIVRSSDALLLVSGSVRVACLDAETFRPRPLPLSLSELRAQPAPARTPPTQQSAEEIADDQ
jgi:YbgC/YbaW family acyl-CoA thioester hydrolase